MDDDERDHVLASVRNNAKPLIQRFKGLGEMPPATLKETTLDPANRTLLQVQVEDVVATDLAFEELMGSDPKRRFEFLVNGADLATAEDLDV